MGRYIEDDGSHVQCLGEKVQYWEGGIGMLAGVTCKHPQAAYAGLQKSLQQEWAFVQHATQGIGKEFQRNHFHPFVVSVNVMFGTEAEATLKRLASRFVKKWRQPDSVQDSYEEQEF